MQAVAEYEEQVKKQFNNLHKILKMILRQAFVVLPPDYRYLL